MFVDVHAHLSFPEFDNDRDEVILRIKQHDISLLVDPGTNVQSSKRSIALAAEHDFVYATVGLHPHDVTQAVSGQTFCELGELAAFPKVVGIGEIGLDYHYEGFQADRQQEAFRILLRMAIAKDLPVVIHSRDAWRDTLKILQEERASNLRGIMHCFSGDTELAYRCIRAGFKISIPGTLTYKKSILPAVVRDIPIEELLTETDAPYLAPVPFRGKRNEPAYVRFVAAKIAEIKEISLEKAAEKLKRNALELFSIPEPLHASR